VFFGHEMKFSVKPTVRGGKPMSIQKLILMFATLLVFSCAAAAQNQPEKVIKRVPITQTSPSSGQEMYRTYCAVCHGSDGKGGGPAASALKIPPTDLTMLSKSHGGKYPSMQVSSAISGEFALPSHGSKEMPVWGSLFWSISGGHQSEVQQRVANLTRYIESLQAK
jgi:mono/diheme cytochrome c family protein